MKFKTSFGIKVSRKKKMKLYLYPTISAQVISQEKEQ